MESGACAERTLDTDLAGVLLNNAIGDGEPQSGTAAVAGLAWAGTFPAIAVAVAVSAPR